MVDRKQYHAEYYASHKESSLAKDKLRYQNNRKKIRLQQKEYWDKNKETILARQKARYDLIKNTPEFRDRSRSQNRQYWDKLKKALFNIIGDKCVGWNGGGCPFHCEDNRCLQVDHKYGNGTKEVKKFGATKSMFIYYRDNPEEAQAKLQPLCANCNWIKRFENNERYQNEVIEHA